jgi:hypothetical protein
MMRKMLLALAALFICGGNFHPLFLWPGEPPRFSAREIELGAEPAERPFFFRPVAFFFNGGNLYVLEADDAEVKVYSQSGVFEHAFGRKGRGPAEFDMPADMDVLAGRLYVADSGNRRVQVLDKKGTYLSGFKVPFFLWRILALEEDRIVVAHLPSGFKGREKMLHCFNRRGELLWEAVDSFYSGDSVYDALRNFVFLKKADKGDFFVIGRSGDRPILKVDKDGGIVREIKIGPDYPSKKIILPLGRKNKELSAFCWNCDWHKNKFYLLIPEYTPSRDVGPGRQMAVVDEAGRVEALVDFPLSLSRVAVAGKIVYGLDSEGELRLFEVGETGIYSSLEEAVANPEQPVLLVFFSLSCHVCWDELFEMKEFIEKYSIPVGIVGIARETPEELRAFVARYSFGHPVVCDRRKELYRRFKVKLEPYRVILEKNRVIYEDDCDLDFFTRRERTKQCLLAIASK